MECNPICSGEEYEYPLGYEQSAHEDPTLKFASMISRKTTVERLYIWTDILAGGHPYIEKMAQTVWEAFQRIFAVIVEQKSAKHPAYLEGYLLCEDSNSDNEAKGYVEGHGKIDTEGNRSAGLGIEVSKDNGDGTKWSWDAKGEIHQDKEGRTSGEVETSVKWNF